VTGIVRYLKKDKGGSPWRPTAYRNLVNITMDTLDLVDIQRTRYPNVNKFSYRSKTLGVKSRIDFFLISKHLTKFVKKVDIQASIAPDHNTILLSLSWPNENPRGPGVWRFNNSLLEDKEYTTKILELYLQLREKCMVLDLANSGIIYDVGYSLTRSWTLMLDHMIAHQFYSDSVLA